MPPLQSSWLLGTPVLSPHLRPTALSAASRAFRTGLPSLYKQPPLAPTEPPIPSATAHQPHIPPYPVGERQFYKQSNTGLYGNARIRFGNNVSERNEIKTPRKWRPNVQEKRLWSEALGTHVRTRVTTRVLRTIDKVGGLDEYLLGEKTGRIQELGPWGWKLRWRIMQTAVVRERFLREREALGLPADGLAGSDPFADETAGSDVPLAESRAAMSKDDMLEETQRMIDGEMEIDLGSGQDEGFMKEKR